MYDSSSLRMRNIKIILFHLEAYIRMVIENVN